MIRAHRIRPAKLPRITWCWLGTEHMDCRRSSRTARTTTAPTSFLKNLSRSSSGLGAPVLFERKIDDSIDAVTFTALDGGKKMTWVESLAANYTDGTVILHDGLLVYEHYSGCLDETGQHGAMSVTKSITGLLGEMLVAEGTLDETAKVGVLVPELANSAFGDATLRQVLEMTTGLRYSEDYADPDSEVWRYSAAGNPLPKPADYAGPRSYFEYLQTVRKQEIGRAHV